MACRCAALPSEAGIAAPSVYGHFADLDELLLAVLERLFAELIALRVAAEEAAVDDPWERLRASVFATVRFGLTRPGHYRMLFEGQVVPALSNPRAATFGRPIQCAASSRCSGDPRRASGRAGENAERLSLLLWAGVHGVISLRDQQAHVGLARRHRARRGPDARRRSAWRRRRPQGWPRPSGRPAIGVDRVTARRQQGPPGDRLLKPRDPQDIHRAIGRADRTT